MAVAREALAGLAETLALSREQYDDVRTAVTEACNNVVQHAYTEGDGPLEMEICVLQDAIEVIVRDAGVGLGHMAADGGGELEIGLPVILALAERVELANPPDGGTEVHMRFGVPGVAALHGLSESVAQVAPGEQAATHGEEILVPGFEAEVRVSFSSSELTGAILPRVAAAMATRAHFSADRVSDVQLLCDSIAADAFRVLDGPHLEAGLAVRRRRLGMQVGPLLRGCAARIGLVEQLVDRLTVTKIGPTEVIVLYLDDKA